MKYLSPSKAVRHECCVCMGGNTARVSDCPYTTCFWFGNRMGRGRVSVKKIRRWCLHCCGLPLDGTAPEGVSAEATRMVAECGGRMIDGSECAFHPYRLGRNPNRKKTYSGASAEQMASMRAAKASNSLISTAVSGPDFELSEGKT